EARNAAAAEARHAAAADARNAAAAAAAADARNTQRHDYGRPPQERGLPPAPLLPVPERHPLEEYGQLEPQVEPDNLWALPLDGQNAQLDRDAGQPAYHDQRYEQAADHRYEEPAPRRVRQPRSYGRYIRLGLVAILILALAGTVYWQRSNIAQGV